MSGGNVFYTLRPNKFVERQLFIELLSKLCSQYSPDRYAYISLGGPQLEDHKLIHHQLGIKTLVSLETDPIIHQRQLFNRRPSYVVCRNESTEDFVTDFDAFTNLHSDNNFIIWFDYASSRERRNQLVEYQTLLSKLQIDDIFKITMNSNPNTLGERHSGETHESVQKRRLEALRRQLDIYLPSSKIEHTQMTGRGLVPILCQAIKKASLNALQSTPRLRPVPLAIFVYQDGRHQMLTVTVRLTQKVDVDLFQQDLSSKWEYLPSGWDDATRINVPALTAKERLYIEGLLFSEDHSAIHEKLPFRFHNKEEKSLQILEEYAKHYRRYPSYFQVVL
jgi:hypothetical protein